MKNPQTPLSEIQSMFSLEEKAEKKTAMQSMLGWPHEPRLALLCIPTEITDQYGGAFIRDILPGLLTLPLQILVRGCGNATYGDNILHLQQQYVHRLAIIPNTEKNLNNMIEASDMALFCSTPDGLPELFQSRASGVIPITPKTPTLEEYNPIQENGIAFFYENTLSPWPCLAAIVRALETYRFPFDWKTIQKECMRKAL